MLYVYVAFVAVGIDGPFTESILVSCACVMCSRAQLSTQGTAAAVSSSDWALLAEFALQTQLCVDGYMAALLFNWILGGHCQVNLVR